MADFGLQIFNASGAETLGIGDSSAIIYGFFDVTGKTATSVGNANGERTFTIPNVPAGSRGWFYMAPIFQAGGSYSDYDSRGYIDPNNLALIRYRIDLASNNTITRIIYGVRGK